MNTKPTLQLKKKIKSKFGTYSNFTRIAGIDRYVFQKDFLCKERVTEDLFNDISFACQKFDNEPKRPILTAERRNWIKEQIDLEGGVIKFCEREGFVKDTVFQIISGYYDVVTPNIQKLIDVLNQKVQEKVL